MKVARALATCLRRSSQIINSHCGNDGGGADDNNGGYGDGDMAGECEVADASDDYYHDDAEDNSDDEYD